MYWFGGCMGGKAPVCNTKKKKGKAAKRGGCNLYSAGSLVCLALVGKTASKSPAGLLVRGGGSSPPSICLQLFAGEAKEEHTWHQRRRDSCWPTILISAVEQRTTSKSIRLLKSWMQMANTDEKEKYEITRPSQKALPAKWRQVVHYLIDMHQATWQTSIAESPNTCQPSC